MTAITPTTYCPECGTENEEVHERCISCDAILDPTITAAAEHAKPPRPFHIKAFAMTAGIAVAVAILFQLAGWTFSMRVLPAAESPQQIAVRVDAIADEGAIAAADAHAIKGEFARNAILREMLNANKLPSSEAQRARETLRPEDQSVVLGIGGVRSLFPPLFAFLLANLVTVAVVRTRRIFEVGLGAGVGAFAQLVAWVVVADFDVGAVFGGELWMTGASLGFKGAPIMLLGMAVMLYVVWAAVTALAFGVAMEKITGIAACEHCEHRFSVRPKTPATCPKCEQPTRRGNGLRYREGDLFFAELGPTQNGVTLASSGADELLCLLCAKTYAADRCPAHPYEPLLDPTRDDVRLRLLDLDAEAGTSRFTKWTGDGLGVDADRFQGWAANDATTTAGPAPRSGPGLCMECAKTYDAQTCPTHPDEPLLDPTADAVRLELIEADDRARSKVSTALIFVSTGIGFAAATGVSLLVEDGMSLAVAVGAGLVIGLVTLSRLATPRLAPPRFTQWTGEGQVDLDEFGMGAHASVWAPVHRWLATARREALRLGIATLVGAAVGAAAAAALVGTAPAIGLLALGGGVIGFVGYAIVASIVSDAKGVVAVVKDAKTAWDDPYA